MPILGVLVIKKLKNMTERSDNTRVVRHPRTYEVRKKGTQQQKPKLKARSQKEVEGAKQWGKRLGPDYSQELNTMGKQMVKSIDKRIDTKNKIHSKALEKKGMVAASEASRITKLQQQLYDKGFFGNMDYKKAVDGYDGRMTQAALKKAQEAGYTYENGQLVTPKKKQSQQNQGQPYMMGSVWGISPQANKSIKIDEAQRSLTPRQYTAAQNTVIDLIDAPVKRGIAKLFGVDVAEKVLPKKVYNENHLSEELYTWLQDAVDKKWSPEERKKYFEENPNAQVNKGWYGRVNKDIKESDYQKYYGTAYTGPMKYGFKETMFGGGLPQAQGTLGSFNIVYTKDGAYVKDDWDFGVGKPFNTNSLMGIIRSAAEKYGSQENDNLESIRGLNALIKYK